ncbi:hypothetical protein JZ751_026437 [Albula glossodonta]|uniref:Uncharacterized protein n=1 Tax=Albula glossodonta TaxID=121402 RepID=A0A8T2PBZ9_9TELE|nr:hypothetical protein JZ751_026437 [Albula glossodonta]
MALCFVLLICLSLAELGRVWAQQQTGASQAVGTLSLGRLWHAPYSCLVCVPSPALDLTRFYIAAYSSKESFS